MASRIKLFLPYIVLIWAGLVLRLLLFQNLPSHRAETWDSVSYGYHARDIVTQQNLSAVFTPIRPPVYPLFISIFFRVTDYGLHGDMYDALQHDSGAWITSSQTLIALLVSLLLFWSLQQLYSQPVAFFIALGVVCHPLLIPWEKHILTESLSISILIANIASIVLALRKPNMFTFLLLTFTAILVTETRTIYGFLFPLTLLFLLLAHPSIRAIRNGIIMILLFSVILSLHILTNMINHQVPTLSVISSVNIFGRIITHPYTIPPIVDDPISTHLTSIAYTPSPGASPYGILHQLSPEFYHDSMFMNQLNSFNYQTVLANATTYLYDALTDIPKIFTRNPLLTSPQHTSLHYWSDSIGIFIFILSAASLITLPYELFKFVTNRSVRNAFTCLCGFSTLLIIATTVLLGYTDYSRISLGAVVFMFIYWGEIIERSRYRYTVHG